MKAYNKNVFLFRSETLKNIQPIHGPQKRPFPAFSIPPRPIRPFINHLLFFYCWGSSLKSHPCKSPLPTSFSYQSFFSSKDHFHYFELNEFSRKENVKIISYFHFHGVNWVTLLLRLTFKHLFENYNFYILKFVLDSLWTAAEISYIEA